LPGAARSGSIERMPPWVNHKVQPVIDNATGQRVMLASVWCQACGARAQAPVQTGIVNGFAQQHAACKSHYGLGDVVAAATKAVGIEPCTPCEERQQMLNSFAPKVWWNS